MALDSLNLITRTKTKNLLIEIFNLNSFYWPSCNRPQWNGNYFSHKIYLINFNPETDFCMHSSPILTKKKSIHSSIHTSHMHSSLVPPLKSLYKKKLIPENIKLPSTSAWSYSLPYHYSTILLICQQHTRDKRKNIPEPNGY